MISLIARLRTVDGKAEEFKAAARQQIAAVKANEAGRTLMYTLQQSQWDSNQFVVYEQYADDAALAAHGQTEHMKAFGGKPRGVVEGRPEIERFDVVAGLGG